MLKYVVLSCNFNLFIVSTKLLTVLILELHFSFEV